MLSMRDLPLAEAVYTFVEHDGTPTHIAASTLLESLEACAWPVTECFIAPSLIEALERGDLGVRAAPCSKAP